MKICFSVRQACTTDAACLSALAVQVFLDTYATEGVSPALARAAVSDGSIDEFERRMDPGNSTGIDVAHDGEHVLGFAETTTAPRSPTSAIPPGAELVRLYIPRRFQRLGIGRALLAASEHRARSEGLPTLWLTAWEGNANALAFYRCCGFKDVGKEHHIIDDQAHGQRILARSVVPERLQSHLASR